jgi:hypothetical protein
MLIIWRDKTFVHEPAFHDVPVVCDIYFPTFRSPGVRTEFDGKGV